PSEPTIPDSPSSAALATLIRARSSEDWQQARCLAVEPLLQQYPALSADREVLLDLIYAEIVLRDNRGHTRTLPEYLRRFPQSAGALRRQFALHEVLRAEGAVEVGSGEAANGPPAAPPDPAPATRVESNPPPQATPDVTATGPLTWMQSPTEAEA